MHKIHRPQTASIRASPTPMWMTTATAACQLPTLVTTLWRADAIGHATALQWRTRRHHPLVAEVTSSNDDVRIIVGLL